LNPTHRGRYFSIESHPYQAENSIIEHIREEETVRSTGFTTSREVKRSTSSYLMKKIPMKNVTQSCKQKEEAEQIHNKNELA
jgi:hypothetical protein